MTRPPSLLLPILLLAVKVLQILIFTLSPSPTVSSTTTFTFINECDYTLYPAIFSNPNSPQFPTTGFILPKAVSITFITPISWSGLIWARTHCSNPYFNLNNDANKFSCITGDCGSNLVDCVGKTAFPPITSLNFALGVGDGGSDYYGVSLADGFNVPVLIVPQNGFGDKCMNTGCEVDLNSVCPSELKLISAGGGGAAMPAIGCKSACQAFNKPEYCCGGAYNTPSTCKPSVYSLIFKTICPNASSYTFDYQTTTFVCLNANYLIIFCPSSSYKHKQRGSEEDGSKLNGSQSQWWTIFGIVVSVVAAVIAVPSCVVAILQLRHRS